MDPRRQPESADDFDRLVLSSPNSSILWVQYMAFHLQATEIEKARAVAERALKTISFRSHLCPPCFREGSFGREGHVSPGCRALPSVGHFLLGRLTAVGADTRGPGIL